jgi:hypothetical protein
VLLTVVATEYRQLLCLAGGPQLSPPSPPTPPTQRMRPCAPVMPRKPLRLFISSATSEGGRPRLARKGTMAGSMSPAAARHTKWKEVNSVGQSKQVNVELKARGAMYS